LKRKKGGKGKERETHNIQRREKELTPFFHEKGGKKTDMYPGVVGTSRKRIKKRAGSKEEIQGRGGSKPKPSWGTMAQSVWGGRNIWSVGPKKSQKGSRMAARKKKKVFWWGVQGGKG